MKRNYLKKLSEYLRNFNFFIIDSIINEKVGNKQWSALVRGSSQKVDQTQVSEQ